MYRVRVANTDRVVAYYASREEAECVARYTARACRTEYAVDERPIGGRWQVVLLVAGGVRVEGPGGKYPARERLCNAAGRKLVVSIDGLVDVEGAQRG